MYTLCLALVLEGCRLEFGVLAQDIRLAEAETRALFRELVSLVSEKNVFPIILRTVNFLLQASEIPVECG